MLKNEKKCTKNMINDIAETCSIPAASLIEQLKLIHPRIDVLCCEADSPSAIQTLLV